MIVALLFFLSAIVVVATMALIVYVGWRVVEDRQEADALSAFYDRLEARNASSEPYDPWLADLDAAGPDREG